MADPTAEHAWGSARQQEALESRPPRDDSRSDETAPTTDRPRPALLLFWTGFLALFAMATLRVLDPLKYVVIGALREGQPVAALPMLLLHGISSAQWLVLVALPLLFAIAVFIEWRHAPLSSLLLRGGARAVLAALLVLLAWFGHSYWVPGYLLAGDSGEHIVRIAHFAQAARNLTLIRWDYTAYEGSPFLQFTGPLFFWLAGGVAVILGDPTIATKTVLFLLHLASGFAFYGLSRALSLGRAAAFVAAIVYAGAFAHLHTLLYRGELPQALVLVFLPLLFWSAELVLVRPRIGDGAWLALTMTLAGLLYTHQTTALFAGLYLTLFVLMRGGLRPALVPLAAAAAASVLLGLPAILPILVEQGWVMTPSGLWVPHLVSPTLEDLDRFLRWRDVATSHGTNSSAYLGITTILLAVAAIALRQAAMLRVMRFAAVALLVSLVLKGSYVRDVLLTLFFLCWLAGYGAELVLARWRWHHAPALLVGLVFLDLGSTAIQVQPRTDKAHLDAAGAYLASTAPGQRVATMSVRNGTLVPDIGPSSSPMLYYDVPTLHGPHNATATLAHNYLAAVAARVAADLNRDGRISPTALTLLGWLDVHRGVGVDPTEMGLPASVQEARPEGPLGRTLAVTASPVRAAGRLVTLEPPPGLDRPMVWADDLAPPTEQVSALDRFLDRVVAVGDAIPVRGPVAAASGDAVAPTIELRRYELDWNRARLMIDSDRPGFIQLAHAWYPWLEVRINGEPVAARQGTLDLVVLPIEAGRSEIVVRLPLTPVRLAASLVAVVMLILSAAAYLRSLTAATGRRDRHGGCQAEASRPAGTLR